MRSATDLVRYGIIMHFGKKTAGKQQREGADMKLDTVGEFGLIDLIQIPDFAPEQLILGIGDDCAVLPFDGRQYQLVSCDLLVEDIHFVRSRISPRQLGYKAVAVNLSDVAAMGGTPGTYSAVGGAAARLYRGGMAGILHWCGRDLSQIPGQCDRRRYHGKQGQINH